MAWSASGVFRAFIADALNNDAPFDLAGDTLKAALFNNGITPSASAASASTAYNAGVWGSGNEVTSSTDWPAGGKALSSVSSSFAGSIYTLDASNLSSGAAASFTGAYGVLLYDDTITSPVADQGILFAYFGGIIGGVSAGVFTIVWSDDGIMRIT